MDFIRKAVVSDASRIAEILIFTKRMNYREIFKNDEVSFGEMQIYPALNKAIFSSVRGSDSWNLISNSALHYL